MQFCIVSDASRCSFVQINELDGYIILAIGPKILMYNFESADELVATAFFDSSIWVNTLRIVRNYVLIGDLYKSVHLLMWREHTRSLTMLAKDTRPLQIAAADFILDDDALSLVVADYEKNLQIMQYQPTSVDSRDGQVRKWRTLIL